jgi:hypothetical protein
LGNTLYSEMLTMPLPYVVETIESVPEAFRTEYAEKDGKFYLALEGADDHFVPKSEWKKINDESTGRRHQINAWKKLGFESPEKAAEAFETQKQLAAQAGDGAAILKQHQDAWATEKAAIESELNAARASERGAVVGERLSGALAKAGATEEGLELLPDRFGSRITFETVDGKRVVKIMKADGATPMAGSGEGGMATLDDLVKEATKKYPSLFKGSGAGGGGKPPEEKGGGGTGAPTAWADCKTDEQKVAFLKAKNEAKG